MTLRMIVWQRLIVVTGLMLIVAGCGPKLTPQQQAQRTSVQEPKASPINTMIRFFDRTQESQVNFTYRNDEENSGFAILESLGGGVAVFDYDCDGRLDLFFPGGGQFGDRKTVGLNSALFRNTSGWKFAETAGYAGVERSPHYSHGAATADYNEDGFDDLLLTGFGGLVLFQNQGDGTFAEIESIGLEDRMWSTSAAWGDFSGDGVLDLYVAHYVDWSFDNNPMCRGPVGHDREVCPPRQFKPLTHVLYYGNGDGTFRDALQEAGIQPVGKGLGVVAADLDRDGDLDLYVTNDTVPNLLFRNDGRGQFSDASSISGTAYNDQGTADGSMGVDVGDYNADGLPDIWVTNYERENNALYRNLENCLFRHVSQSTGIAAIEAMYVGWGTRFVDADLDGDEDLIVANGHVIRFPTNSPRLQRPLVLENINGMRFVNVASEAGEYMVSSHCGRGLATGDLDGDGDEDVVISNLNEPVAVLSNESTSRRNWLAVRVIGRGSARASIGAVAVADLGDQSLTRQIRGGSSFASTSDTRLHFGCGSATQIDKLTVTWIGGSRIVLNDVACNQVITIVEPAAK